MSPSPMTAIFMAIPLYFIALKHISKCTLFPAICQGQKKPALLAREPVFLLWIGDVPALMAPDTPWSYYPSRPP